MFTNQTIQKIELHNQQVVSALEGGPLMSVVIPVRNAAFRHLHGAILSVARQTYKNWELVICNDASENAETRLALEHAKNTAELMPEKIQIIEIGRAHV